MPPAPGAVNAGGYLRWGGNQKLYAYQGGTTALWVFDISTNVWSTLAVDVGWTGAGASWSGPGTTISTARSAAVERQVPALQQ